MSIYEKYSNKFLKENNGTLKDKDYVKYVETELLKNKSATFLFEAFKEKIDNLEEQLEIVNKKVQNTEKFSQLVETCYSFKKEEVKEIRNKLAEQEILNKELLERIEKIEINFEDHNNLKINFENDIQNSLKDVIEKTDENLKLQRNIVLSAVETTANKNSEKIEKFQKNIENFIESFSKDVAFDIKEIQRIITANDTKLLKAELENHINSLITTKEASSNRKLVKNEAKMFENIDFLYQEFKNFKGNFAEIEKNLNETKIQLTEEALNLKFDKFFKMQKSELVRLDDIEVLLQNFKNNQNISLRTIEELKNQIDVLYTRSSQTENSLMKILYVLDEKIEGKVTISSNKLEDLIHKNTIELQEFAEKQDELNDLIKKMKFAKGKTLPNKKILLSSKNLKLNKDNVKNKKPSSKILKAKLSRNNNIPKYYSFTKKK